MRKYRQSRMQNSSKFLLLSLSFHFLLWGLVFHFKSQNHLDQLNPPVEVELISRQIVEQDKSLNDKKPETDDYYLSHSDQSVSKQTKAAQTGKFQNKNASTPQSLDLSLGPAWKNLDQIPLSRFKSKKEQNEKFSQTDDYLKNVDIDFKTNLNTKSYVFYTYYHQIREKLRPLWSQNVRKIIYELRGSRKTGFRTNLVVLLDKNGNISDIRMGNSSGYEVLDKAAVEAFHNAAPFPNPPSGIQKNGEFRLEWSFILET